MEEEDGIPVDDICMWIVNTSEVFLRRGNLKVQCRKEGLAALLQASKIAPELAPLAPGLAGRANQ